MSIFSAKSFKCLVLMTSTNGEPSGLGGNTGPRRKARLFGLASFLNESFKQPNLLLKLGRYMATSKIPLC